MANRAVYTIEDSKVGTTRPTIDIRNERTTCSVRTHTDWHELVCTLVQFLSDFQAPDSQVIMPVLFTQDRLQLDSMDLPVQTRQ